MNGFNQYGFNTPLMGNGFGTSNQMPNSFGTNSDFSQYGLNTYNNNPNINTNRIGLSNGPQTAPGMSPWAKAETIGNLATGALQGFLGLQQYGLAKDQFKFQKNSYEQNYANQKSTTNRQLEERQERRVAGGASNISVNEYMNRYGIK